MSEAYQLKLEGFRAHCETRGRAFRLGTAGPCVVGLIETVGQFSGEFSVSEEESSSCKIHIAREDLVSPLVITVGEFWMSSDDSKNKAQYRITSIANQPVSPVIVFTCQIK